MSTLHVIAVATAAFLLGNCAQNPEELDKRHRIFKVQGTQNAQKSYKIVKNFDSTQVSDTELKYTTQYRINRQNITLKRQYENTKETFQQLNRTVLRENFSQGKMGSETQESFLQKNFGILDILLVLDNSHSMEEEHKKISTQLPSLLSHVGASDWQVILTTTDPADGCFSKIIRKTDPNPAGDFEQEILKTGVSGTGDESGFLQISNALSCADQWLRPDSNLGIIIVSDEDNCSDGSLCANNQQESADVSFVTDVLSQHRTLGEDLRVYGIFWKPTDSVETCSTAFRPAYLYQELVRQSMGTSGSICDESYEETFKTVSQDLFTKLKFQFILQSSPLPNSVAVKVNEESMTEGFEVTGNIIRFNQPPPRDSKINVSYRYGESTMQSVFNLNQNPDSSSVKLWINDEPVASTSFRVVGKEVHFNEMPPEGAKISTSYREGIPLPNSYQLRYQGEVTNLVLYRQDQVFENFIHNPSEGTIIFDEAPSDGETFEISYRIPGSPVLKYLSGLITKTAPLDLRAYLTNAPDTSVSVSFEDNNFVISEGDFQEGGSITIEHRDPSDEETTFPLPHRPIKNSLWINSTISDCEKTSFKLEETEIKTNCPMAEGELILVKYKFILKHSQEFSVSEKPSEKGIWHVFVNDKQVDDFQRQGNLLKFTKPLPLYAKVRVEIIENM